MRITKFLSTVRNDPYEGMLFLAGFLIVAAGRQLAKEGRPLHHFSDSFNDRVFSLIKRKD